ncbi:MAG: hypothetical protein K2M16_00300 [Muribaculaceae bacterium]|nr:hypothetical protein [Muribaculaceae bacterium]
MKITKYLNANTASIAGFVVFAYWLLAIKNGFMLRWYDEMSLFEPTRIFFRQFLYYPGGLLRHAGTWLTQLLYHPWLGTSALIVLWLMLWWLTCKAFNLMRDAAPIALIVPIALLVSVVQLDEAWLTLKTTGYIFSNTLGYLFTAGTIALFRLASPRPIDCTATSLLIAACYPIAGFYALLSAVICIILSIKTAIHKKQYVLFGGVVLTILLIAVIPPVYYTYLQGNTVDNDYLYLKGLPELLMESFDIYLWIPFIVATVWMLLLALAEGTTCLGENRYIRWVGIATVCLGCVWGVRASHKSEQLRATVLMLQHLDKNDWQGMSGIMSRIKEPPNYTMRLLNRLALANQGREGESPSGYSAQAGDGRHSEKFTMTAFINVPVYYNIGRFNQSYRWAMEHTVQYGKRVFFLKYMVKDALLRGEIQLAKRYNNILLATMFHREWAEHINRFIENPSLIDTDPEFRRILEYEKMERPDVKDGNGSVDNENIADVH